MEFSRTEEQEKYGRAYQAERYAMGATRMKDAVRDLAEVCAVRGSYLDVGCGRGEMLAHAKRLGYKTVRGVEVVASLIDWHEVIRGEAHALPFPDNSFDTVSMFDVIEHLVPGDDEAACKEMERVAVQDGHILLTANNKDSKLTDGTQLHINKRPYEEWDALFRQWFSGTVTWIKGRVYVSEGWRIDL